MKHRPDWRVTNLDALTYSGNLENLRDIEKNPRYRFVKGDICDGATVRDLARECDAIAHFAAESHVDRSIIDSQPFLRANVLGTQTLLDAARAAGGRRFAHVSTDEVYGSLPLERKDSLFTEETHIAPNSPYAASNAASDMLVRARSTPSTTTSSRHAAPTTSGRTSSPRR